MNAQLFEFYEAYAEKAPCVFPPELSGRDGIIKPLLPIDNVDNSTVLEYGFGLGKLLLYAANYYKHAIGYEISQVRIDRFKQYLREGEQKNIELYQSSEDLLPDVASNTVDTIQCLAVLEHVLDPYRLLDEFYRIAKDTTTMIISVPNYAYLKHRIKLLFGHLPMTGSDGPISNWRNDGWDGHHLHCFTQSAFTVLLNECGWRPIQWHGWGNKFVKLRNLRPGLLSGEIIAVCQKKRDFA